MHIFDIFSEEDLDIALEQNLVSVRTHASLPNRVIYNYTPKAPYTLGAWDNPAVSNCRGIITDEEGFVVSRPWPKFHNYGQFADKVYPLDEPVEVSDKRDGSLGVGFYDNNGVYRIATRGSMVSEQAIHATSVWSKKYSHIRPPQVFTFLFEIIYRDNIIVVDYGDMDDLVLLGAVHIYTGEFFGPQEAQKLSEYPGPVTEVFEYQTLAEALQAKPRPNAEGLVVRYLDKPLMVKLKQQDYLLAHRVLTGNTEKTLWERRANGESVESIMANVPDEFTGYVVGIITELEIKRAVWLDEVRRVYRDIEYIESQKEFASYAMKYPFYGALFAMRQGNSDKVDAFSWKVIKPKVDTNKEVG